MMRIRPFLLSSAAALALLLAGAAPRSEALAQKGGMLSPSSAWVVTKVDEGNAGGRPYCALAKRFKEGTVLTFARNYEGKSSLALDLKQPQLDAGRTVSVAFDPGAGEQRVYEITPVSDKALVARLGRDAAFFGALEKTGYLRVDVDGKAYNFDLADIDQGQERLDDCLADLAAPMDGEPSETARTGDISAEPYKKELEALRSKVLELQRQNEELAQAASTVSEARSHLGTGTVEDLTRQVKALQKENKELQLEVAMATSAMPPPADNMGELEDVKAENLRLRAALQAHKPDSGALKKIEAEMRALKAENGVLKEKVSRMAQGGESASKESAELRALRAENTRLLSALKAQGRAIEANQLAAVDMKKGIAVLEAKNEALVRKIDSIKKESKARYEAEIKGQREKNKLLKADSDQQKGNEKLLAELRQQIQDMEKENLRLKEAAASEKEPGAGQEDRRGQDEAPLAAAGQAVEAKASGDRDSGQMQETVDKGVLAELQARIAVLQGEKAALLQRLDSARGKENLRVDGEIVMLRAENKKLKADLERARTEGAGTESLQIEELQAKLDLVLKDNKALKARLEARDGGARSNEEIELLRQENVRLREELKRTYAQEKGGDIGVLQKKSKELSLSLARALEELESLRKEAREKDRAFAALKEENERLKRDLQAKGGSAAEVLALRETLEGLRAENAQLKERVAALGRDKAALQARLEEALTANAPQTLSGAPPSNQEDKARIAELERRLGKADIEKQEAMQALAREYMALKGRREVPYTRGEHAEMEKEAMPSAGISSPEGRHAAASHTATPGAAVEEHTPEKASPVSDKVFIRDALQTALEKKTAHEKTMPDPGAYDDNMTEAQRMEMEMEMSIRPPLPVPASGEAESAPQQGAPASGIYKPSFALAPLLQRAGVVEPSRINVVSKASGPSVAVYQWKVGGVFGTAEQRPVSSDREFKQLVNNYLERTQKRCRDADFSIVPAEKAARDGEVRIDSYEVACVGEKVRASASLLFFRQKNTFTVIAHETPVEGRDKGADIRDRIQRAITES